MKKKIVVAIGGSSGSIYAKLLLDKLSTREDLIIGVVMTDNAKINWEIEIGPWNPSDYEVNYYENNDYYAPFASGSAQYECMIVCPCSMGLLSRINHGISNDFITRATDVILKERRKLIVVPREAPYNLIHLRNMTSLTEAGAIICPATPSFYSNPNTLDEIALTVVDRVIDLAGINQSDTYRWSES